MVYDQWISAELVERWPMISFLIGIGATVLAWICALMVFGTDAGVMTLAFLSIFMIPTLNKVLLDEERQIVRQRRVSFAMLIKDYGLIYTVYGFLFVGVFFTFGVIAILLDNQILQYQFSSQLSAAGITGQAFAASTVGSILLNNLKVLVACLILSLIYGSGSLLFLVWNASVWGVVIGYSAKQAAAALGTGVLSEFSKIIVPVLPHLLTEASSYLSAAIVGGVLYKAVLREKFNSARFRHIVRDAAIYILLSLLLVYVAAVIEVKLFPKWI